MRRVFKVKFEEVPFESLEPGDFMVMQDEPSSEWEDGTDLCRVRYWSNKPSTLTTDSVGRLGRPVTELL